MHIQLLSHDPELCRLCREVLAELPIHSMLSAPGTDEVKPGSDAYLLDFEPGVPIPAVLNENLANTLFLVDRKDLETFRNQIAAESKILLKPVTRGVLAVFLKQLFRVEGTPVETNLRLQEYDRDRTNFLAYAIHDFRAPLTALSGYCGLLLDGPPGSLDDTQREVLNRMHNSIQRLSRMSSAMSLLSAGAQVKKQPNLEQADLSARVDQSIHETAWAADEKNISVTSDLEPCCDLYFQPDQVEQVLVNLLDNACRFTPRSGSIQIRGYRWFWERRTAGAEAASALERRENTIFEPNSYRVDIRDSGAAIPQENLNRIFEEYTSFGGARDRSGGGLGLAICKKIVSQHEGKIWVENTALGPVFSFVLPIHRLEVQPAVNRDGKSLQLLEIGAH